MAHWAAQPGIDLLELDYDALTEDPEPHIRRTLAYIGVPWDPAVLAPDKNARPVHTSSSVQIRSGVYRNSSDDWKRYAGILGDRFSQFA